MSKKENVWSLTEKQYKILQNCAKVNSVLYFGGESKSIVSTNALDESFTVFYLNTDFNFEFNNKFVIHNINEVIKSLKMIEKGKVFIENDKIIITDSDENVKCKFLFANLDIIENVKALYSGYDEILSGIKESDGCVKINFKKDYFDKIKKFLTPNFNTMSIEGNKISLFDNTGSNNVAVKDSVEIHVEGIEVPERFDIDVSLFRVIEESDYDCYLSPGGFVLFEDLKNGNTYGVATNIIEK
jgi:hypothetical protein